MIQQLYTVDNETFLYGWCEHHFVSELNNEYFSRQIFKTVFEWLSLTWHWQFASMTS